MKRGFYYTIALAVAVSLLSITASSRNHHDINNNLTAVSDTGFVVMELFTSQGCSSCPPADELLGSYAMKNDDHIIPLAFHVDYWNRLGWTDPFSNSLFSQRQKYYSEKLNLQSVYTPQLIINGQKQLVGSDREKVATITADFLKEKAAVTINATISKAKGNSIQVDYKLSNLVPNSEIHAALVQQNAITQIKAGENSGRKLNNYNVVRDFKTNKPAGISGNFIVELPAGNNAANYQVILFTQDNNSGIITGAVKKDYQ